jgi:hypothetical protein
MSLASLILAFLPPLAAKLNPKPQPATKRERELEAEVERLTFALDYWRTTANRIVAANDQLRDDCYTLQLEARQLSRAWCDAQQLAQYQNCHNALAQQQARLQEAYDFICNCTPGRAQLLAP